MKRLLFLLTSLFIAVPSVHAMGTWALVQHPRASCNGASCGITVSATGSGNLGIVIYMNDSASDIPLTSVSDGTSTWTVGCRIRINSIGNIDVAYSLSLASGKTTETVTPSGSGFNGEAEFLEYSTTGPPPVLDACNGTSNPSSTTPLGQILGLTGTNDVIVQALNPGGGTTTTAPGGSYTNPADTFVGPDNGGLNYGIAGAINTINGSAPTWTLGTSQATIVLGLAFTETPPPTGSRIF